MVPFRAAPVAPRRPDAFAAVPFAVARRPEVFVAAVFAAAAFFPARSVVPAFAVALLAGVLAGVFPTVAFFAAAFLAVAFFAGAFFAAPLTA